MNRDVLLARIVITIQSGEAISPNLIQDNIGLFERIEDRADLCNSIVITHKKKYEQCYTPQDRESEIKRMLGNYRIAFNSNLLQFVDPELISAAFFVFVENDVFSIPFRELCVALMQKVGVCSVPEVCRAVYSRIISTIIRSHLYGGEPYDSILRQCVEGLDSIAESGVYVAPISFLE